MKVFYVGQHIFNVLKNETLTFYNVDYQGFELLHDWMDFSRGDVVKLAETRSPCM